MDTVLPQEKGAVQTARLHHLRQHPIRFRGHPGPGVEVIGPLSDTGLCRGTSARVIIKRRTPRLFPCGTQSQPRAMARHEQA